MIGIVDYRAGNLTSVERALRHLGISCEVSSEAAVLRRADRIIFPGVGAAGEAMANLRATGMDRLLGEVLAAGRPVLGICLGTQIIFERSEENDAECLGFVPGLVRRFPADMNAGGRSLKIPHMGWNRVAWRKDHPVFRGIPPEAEFYFVHSYYPVPSDEAWIAGWTEYGIRFCSAVARNNLAAVQFHPEKSGAPGLSILENFSRWGGTDAQ
jgi:glutamine amidotransferase